MLKIKDIIFLEKFLKDQINTLKNVLALLLEF